MRGIFKSKILSCSNYIQLRALFQSNKKLLTSSKNKRILMILRAKQLMQENSFEIDDLDDLIMDIETLGLKRKAKVIKKKTNIEIFWPESDLVRVKVNFDHSNIGNLFIETVRELVRVCLIHYKNKRNDTFNALGVSEKTLYNYIQRFNVKGDSHQSHVNITEN